MRLMRIVAVMSVFLMLVAGVFQVSAEAPTTNTFERTWARTDKPVADDVVERTWMWGPEAFTGEIEEDYADAPGGTRVVQYFDKSRMEENAYRGTDPWDVTNGLLVVEMMTGAIQIGDDEWKPSAPAEIPVAGDPDSIDVPTYATMAEVMDVPAMEDGEAITSTIARDGAVGTQPRLGAYGVTAADYVEQTQHTVAEPFWEFMTATGEVYEDDEYVTDALFEDPYYATGFPVTEAYWTRATVNGSETDVLVQAFQRRILTYTPSNPDGWQVESGNVGRHYYAWRYSDDDNEPDDLDGGVLATFEVVGETFNVWVTNPNTIAQLEALQAGEGNANIPIGPIAYGPGEGDHNAPWNWHYDPERVEMAEMTIELCDAVPSYVEENLQEFVETIGAYCPWGAQLIALVDYRTEEPTAEPS